LGTQLFPRRAENLPLALKAFPFRISHSAFRIAFDILRRELEERMKELCKLSLAMAAGIVLLSGCATQQADTAAAGSATPAVEQRSEPVDKFEIPTQLTSTPSGLQYSIVKEGTGAEAGNGQKVDVHYTGWLMDGTKFDSSRDRGAPFSFVVGQGRVIKGWDEGVAGMKVGEQRILMIPAALGYGARGAGGVIPPNANLVFKVELVNVY
jgi:FKBP-type peptidyl-prolyl cis-trans isomerase